MDKNCDDEDGIDGDEDYDEEEDEDDDSLEGAFSGLLPHNQLQQLLMSSQPNILIMCMGKIMMMMMMMIVTRIIVIIVMTMLMKMMLIEKLLHDIDLHTLTLHQPSQ